MTKTKCLVIDDEPPARELLLSYLSRVEDFEIAGQFDNSLDAFSYLLKHQVDLIFLDIQMPGMTGLELIGSLPKLPRIVLTTAYREYATDGFDLDVLDYLVKPISFGRFMKAIGKFHQYFCRPEDQWNDDASFNKAYFFIKVGKDQVKIFFRDILYVECIKDYLKIVVQGKTYITYDRMMYMEEKLPEGKFLRVHKSFIVALAKIKAFRNDSVKIGDTEIPVGRVYKQRFLNSFHQ